MLILIDKQMFKGNNLKTWKNHFDFYIYFKYAVWLDIFKYKFKESLSHCGWYKTHYVKISIF